MLLTNGFEAGTSGTGITAANSGPPGSAFDSVTAGTGTTFAYDNSQVQHGSLSAKVASGSTAAKAMGVWSTSLGSGQTQLWWRVYLYFTALPGTKFDFIKFHNPAGSTLCAQFSVNAVGTFIFQDSTATTKFTTTNGLGAGVSLNTWFRLEGFVIASTTVGQGELKIFTASGGDSTTALETKTSAASENTGAALSDCQFGNPSSQANVPSSGAAFWMDDIGVSDGGYIGAAVPATDTETGSFFESTATGGTNKTTHIGVDDAVGFP